MGAALAMTRSVHYAATLLLEGAVVFRFLVIEPAFGGAACNVLSTLRAFLNRTLALTWVVTVLSGAAWVLVLGGQISGESPLSALRWGIDWTLLTQTQFGEVWQWRGAVALLLVLTPAIADRGKLPIRMGRGLAIVLVLTLTGSLAWSGHGAATPGKLGDLHLSADILHIIAAGLWLGGLLPFAVLLWMARHEPEVMAAAVATRRFSSIALISVLVLLATGIVNSWVLVGSAASLLDTVYGRLLLAKIGLFLLMLVFAAVNRFHLTPQIGRNMTSGQRAAGRIAVHSIFEFALGMAILAIVAVLGTLPPRGH
jgi:putative copper resistance protein D